MLEGALSLLLVIFISLNGDNLIRKIIIFPNNTGE